MMVHAVRYTSLGMAMLVVSAVVAQQPVTQSDPQELPQKVAPITSPAPSKAVRQETVPTAALKITTPAQAKQEPEHTSPPVVEKGVVPAVRTPQAPVEHKPAEGVQHSTARTNEHPEPQSKVVHPDKLKAEVKDIKHEEKAPLKKGPIEEEIQLSTIGKARINWLDTRVWYEHSQDALDELTKVFSQIIKVQQNYIEKRDELDNFLEQAFVNLGIEQGRLSETVEYILDLLMRAAKQEGELKKSEKALLARVETKKKDVELMKEHIDYLVSLDNSIDAVIKRVIDQINLCNIYNKTAHEYFQAIPEGNKNPKDLFYGVDSALKNMQAIERYLTVDLANYFNQLLSTAHQRVQELEGRMSGLEKEGIDIKQEAARLFEPTREKAPAESEADVVPQEEPLGFFGAVGAFFGKIWSYITSFFGA